jgi:hypothetical protein
MCIIYTYNQTITVFIGGDETISYNNCLKSIEVQLILFSILEFWGPSTAQGPTPARTAHTYKPAAEADHQFPI